MLLELARWLQGLENFFGLFAYLTFRGILAALTALFLSLWWGPAVIRRLGQLKGGQPIAPKASITSSTVHTYLLRRSPHSSTEASTVIRIIAPPMVGVPALEKCDCGPSLRIGWPPLSWPRRRITAGPHHNDRNSEVSAARMPRKVR